MTYPQVGTYPLTFETAGIYAESLKTAKAAFTPRQSVFFMPMAWMRVGNTQYRPEPSLAAFSESTPLFCGILRRLKKMTTLSDVYGVCINLRQILNRIIENPEYTAADDDAEDAICTAINSLASAMAYLPLEDISDRKIKIQILKKTITEAAEDRDGNVDIDRLTPCAREQMAMVEQLLEA